MREMLVDSCNVEGESGNGYGFRYYILIDEMDIGGGFACESYGVKVACADGPEEASVPNITTSVSRIDALVELLRRNAVTPATLRDVVEDWL